MTAAAPSPPNDEPDRRMSHVEMLDQLARTGFEIAEAMGRRAKAMALDETSDPGDLAVLNRSLERMVRAVRFTVVLHDKLAKAAKADQAALLKDHKAGLVRIVKRIAEAEGQDAAAVIRIGWKAAERLERDDIYGDILNRPVTELIPIICEDLDLSPDWPKLAREAWARAEIEGGGAGWPPARPPPRYPSPLVGEGVRLRPDG